MARILILGGGFAGLVTAEKLAAAVGGKHEITLISPKRDFTFYPALVRLAFGRCSVEDITFDLRTRLRSLSIRHIEGEVLEIDPMRREVWVTGHDVSGKVEYDYVVFAMGRRLATEGVLRFFEHAHHLLGVGAAKKFGAAVESFGGGTIVVGLSPEARLPVPVCETAFALSRRFPDEMAAGTVSVKVIFPGSLSDAFGGAELHKELEEGFARNNIQLLYDVPISELTGTEIISSEKHRIGYDLLMLVPPFKGQALLRPLHITDERDFVQVDGQMKVHGIENAYAAGDIVAFSGPKLAHMAVRQAEVVAGNLQNELAGELPEHTYYHEVASIIDAGGRDSIYLHYGVWDDELYNVKRGRTWGLIKEAHDAVWRLRHGQGA